jgi:glycosyltransferase involved in cell wall biosynthesis
VLNLTRAKLVFVGDGPLRRAAEIRARTLGINQHVMFMGRLDEWAKDRLLRSATAFTFMSKLEGCPLAVLEAMACGLPIVAVDGGPMKDLIGVMAVKEEMLAERLAGVLMMNDRDKAILASRNKLRWATLHTPDAFLDGIQRSYRQAVDRSA